MQVRSSIYGSTYSWQFFRPLIGTCMDDPLSLPHSVPSYLRGASQKTSFHRHHSQKWRREREERRSESFSPSLKISIVKRRRRRRVHPFKEREKCVWEWERGGSVPCIAVLCSTGSPFFRSVQLTSIESSDIKFNGLLLGGRARKPFSLPYIPHLLPNTLRSK